jgi:D-alanyl-D-alanine carboxypeptidase (penicillin-binding protein 5/6)
MNKLLILIIILLSITSNLSSNPNLQARTGILFDYHSEEVLYELDPDIQIYPASMTKIMTAIVAFDLLKKINYHLMMNLQFRKCLETFSSRILVYVYYDQ